MKLGERRGVWAPFTLEDVRRVTQAQPDEEAEPLVLEGLSGLHDATPEMVSVFTQPRVYAKAARETKAGACFVRKEHRNYLPKTTRAFISQDPFLDFIRLANTVRCAPTPVKRIHPTAILGPNVTIGLRCIIGPYAVLQENVNVGDDCVIGPHAFLAHTVVGNHVRIDGGAHIGDQGYGFVLDPKDPQRPFFRDVPHVGRVIIGDHAVIGALTVIDRGSFQDTKVGAFSRIASLVQIGHNVTVGDFVVICSQVGLAGSCIVEDGCVLGGQVGIADHVRLGAGTKVAASSGVASSSKPGSMLGGTPAVDVRVWRRQVARHVRDALKEQKLNDKRNDASTDLGDETVSNECAAARID